MTAVRPGTLDDASAYLDLRRACIPWQVNTTEGMRHFWSGLQRRQGALFAVDDADGSGLAGFALAQREMWTSEEGAVSLGVTVRADRRRTGIGSSLLAAAEDHLRSVGGKRVKAWALGEPADLDFVQRRGYELSAEARYSRAYLADLPPEPPLSAAVTTVSLADLGPEATYAVDSASMLDEPGDTALDKVEYDDWVADIWEDPIQRLDLGVAVLVDGVAAAVTIVEGDPESGRLTSAGTGTLRQYRGRGLAKLAKVVSLHRAYEAGFVEAFTSNNEGNAPMLAINTWLGYRTVGSERCCLKQL